MTGVQTCALPIFLLNQVHDAINAADANGILHTWNVASERLYGYSAEEAIGKHVSLLLFPEDHNDFYGSVMAPVLANGRLEITLRNRRKDGTEIYVALRLSVIRDSDGNVRHIIGCSNDITARKRAEDGLRLEVQEIGRAHV